MKLIKNLASSLIIISLFSSLFSCTTSYIVKENKQYHTSISKSSYGGLGDEEQCFNIQIYSNKIEYANCKNWEIIVKKYKGDTLQHITNLDDKGKLITRNEKYNWENEQRFCIPNKKFKNQDTIRVLLVNKEFKEKDTFIIYTNKLIKNNFRRRRDNRRRDNY